MDNKATVVVLMSTYNGEAHLEEQIKSILGQEGVNVRLIIRDDGSKDNTVSIAKKYSNEVIIGKNLGYRYSFLELIKNAPEADYYALSDQDDIWLPEKLFNAVTLIRQSTMSETNDKPILYACSRKNFINGEIVEAKEVREYKQFKFNAWNNGWHLQGCTMVMNRSFRDILSSYIPKDLITSHDVWIHQVCKAIDGIIVYDKRPMLLYRIGENEIGVPKNRKIKKLLWFFQKHPNSDVINLCSNLLRGYSSLMSADNIRICKLFVNYQRNKIPVLFCGGVYRGDLYHRINLFLMILFNAA
jgi:rhamnosyltransferase